MPCRVTMPCSLYPLAMSILLITFQWTAWVNGSNSAVVEAVDWLGTDAYPYFQNLEANSVDVCIGLGSICSHHLTNSNRTAPISSSKPTMPPLVQPRASQSGSLRPAGQLLVHSPTKLVPEHRRPSSTGVPCLAVCNLAMSTSGGSLLM